MNSNTNSPKKMTPSQLEGWLAIRKKCAPQKSKKAYTRKEKHKQNRQSLKIKPKGRLRIDPAIGE